MKLALMSFTVLFVVLVSLIRFSSIEATVDEDGRTIRSYSFLARPSSLPLRDQLIYTTTQLYDEWPKRLNRLPRTINAAVAHSDNFNGTLMGQPIHCQVGDRLQINLTNDISYSGLSLHMHGFGYGGEFFYDGSVGVSQCPLGDAKSQMYDLVVEEAPGTYWYHTQSGHLGVNAVDMIRGPLIVHPNGTFPRVELSPLSYDNERILFFQDGSLLSSEARYARQIGNSNGPAVRNDEGFIVSSDPWDFGTCNGKLREVIHVKRNKKHKLRLINGGTHHALRIAIDNFFMTVVAVDSEPIEPFKADEVVLHVGERVDVIVDVYGDLFESETFWIRADSLGPSSRGFSNGIRAVLRISEEQGPVPNDKDIADPPQNIQTVRDEEKVIKTLNCHSQKYSECIPVTALRPLNVSKAEESRLNSEIHYVDLHSKSAPQYSHFVRVDNGGNFTQNELPLVALASRNFDRLTDWHPNTVMLELSRTSPNIIVWRNTMLTDIPFNIHGQKVEILDIAFPTLEHCTLQSCKFTNKYDVSSIRAVDKTQLNTAIKKDTFVVPAGGAIVVRLTASNRGLWLASSTAFPWGDDGLSLVVNIGDYPVPPDEDLLLEVRGLPSCSTVASSKQANPSCECYNDKDAPLRSAVDDERSFCSRPHTCLGQQAPSASQKYDRGIHIQLDWWRLPGGIELATFLIVVILNFILVIFLPPIRDRGSGPLSRLRPNSRRSSSVSFRVGGSDPAGWRSSQVIRSSAVPPMSSICSDDQDDSSNDQVVPDVRLPPPPPKIGSFSSLRLTALSDEFPINEGRAKRVVDKLGESSEEPSSSTQPTTPSKKANKKRHSVGWRRISAISARSSFSSAFGHVFERDSVNEASGPPVEAFDFAPNGFRVQGSIDIVPVDVEKVNIQSPFVQQLRYLMLEQWSNYFPACANVLRFLEVAGVAALSGVLFGGSDATTTRIAELNNFVLLTSLYFTFSRMYPSVISHHDWFKTLPVVIKYKRFSLASVFSSRVFVVVVLECIWPTVYVFICFSLAGLLGDVKLLCQISFLVASNNICYISLGALIGSVASSMQYAITAVTMLTQVTLLAAGVFNELPPSLEWARKASPFYWTVQGLLKSVFKWTDNTDCVVGSSSDLPMNQCFIEFDPTIHQYRRKGISAVMYNDPSSENVLIESLILVAMSVAIQTILFMRCFLVAYRVKSPNVVRLRHSFVETRNKVDVQRLRRSFVETRNKVTEMLF